MGIPSAESAAADIGSSASKNLNTTKTDPRCNLLSCDRGIIELRPTGMRFINGVASSYDDDYPPELHGLVSEEAFEAAINQINNTLTDYWPCFFCFGCGYACCVCTLGMSLLCPNLCISDAEGYTKSLIERINKRQCFRDVGVEWALRKRCGRSWIEITYPCESQGMHKENLSSYQTILSSETARKPISGYGSSGIVEAKV